MVGALPHNNRGLQRQAGVGGHGGRDHELGLRADLRVPCRSYLDGVGSGNPGHDGGGGVASVQPAWVTACAADREGGRQLGQDLGPRVVEVAVQPTAGVRIAEIVEGAHQERAQLRRVGGHPASRRRARCRRCRCRGSRLPGTPCCRPPPRVAVASDEPELPKVQSHRPSYTRGGRRVPPVGIDAGRSAQPLAGRGGSRVDRGAVPVWQRLAAPRIG
jgi:hypothetical protein